MPTYKNSSDRNVNIGGINLAPNETVELVKQFKDGDLVTVGDEVRYYGDVIGFAITVESEDPYYILALDYNDLSFGGAATQTLDGLLDAKTLRVSTDVDIEIRANSASNPYPYPLDANETIDISNSGTIRSLAITSTGSGTVRVIQLARLSQYRGDI